MEESAAILAYEDFYFYCRWLFWKRRGYKWIRGRHHQIIADALMRVFHGECKRLIINVPPRYSKTEMAVIGFISWTLGRVPDAEFIHTSYSGHLASNNAWAIREIVKSDEYQEIFPEVDLRTDSQARDEWRTTAGGVVYAVGAGGTITGYGAGKHRPGFGGAIILDDPHKADEASSDVIREGVLTWFQNTLESRKNSPDTPIILIMQRLHERDLSGWLLDGGNGEIWEHVCLPVEDGQGEPMWPEKHSKADLERMREHGSFVYAGQYLQSPMPPGGGILKEKWWREWPDGKPMPVCDHIFCSWDTAYSEKDLQNSAYSVRTDWGIWWDEQTDRYEIILLSAWEGRVDYPDLEAEAIRVDKEIQPDRHLIEKKASGQSLIQSLRRRNLSIYPYSPDRDKVARAYAVQSMLEAGQIWYDPTKSWARRVVEMCAKFPKGSAPSADYTDTVTQAWLYLRNGWWVSGHPDDPEEEPEESQPRRIYG